MSCHPPKPYVARGSRTSASGCFQNALPTVTVRPDGLTDRISMGLRLRHGSAAIFDPGPGATAPGVCRSPRSNSVSLLGKDGSRNLPLARYIFLAPNGPLPR